MVVFHFLHPLYPTQEEYPSDTSYFQTGYVCKVFFSSQFKAVIPEPQHSEGFFSLPKGKKILFERFLQI